MDSKAPAQSFLVLSAPSLAPYDPTIAANKFLVLSPTEFGPDARVFEEAITESNIVDQDLELHRSNSNSSASSLSTVSTITDTLPNEFLYLGHGKPKTGQ
ncbi:hypothetical protein N7495_002261 [Penicillium taxi]|uniref:uncharacterized protein n=1 Tax=Penicillium taxi TaxID=168475 RepID=UPI0025455345|nr:uncharacterized protein N7495_002261 [Penicillium taxi]KAJ5901733.1 hypothetical protein N7495_002261 [Penicillium taxi]